MAHPKFIVKHVTHDKINVSACTR